MRLTTVGGDSAAGRYRARHPLRDLFRGTSVLIVEDEYFLADDLARRFESAGAMVVGPAGSVSSSLAEVNRAGVVGVAVLDIRLGGELVFPVADELSGRAIPFVFVSGYDEVALPARYRHRRRLRKDADLDAVVAAALAERAFAEVMSEDFPGDADEPDVEAMLPRLRLMARLLTGEKASADDLVAEALRHAIAHAGTRPRAVSLLRWLVGMIEELWLANMRSRPH